MVAQVPVGWVSSGEAGRMLGLSRAGARNVLEAAGVPRQVFRVPGRGGRASFVWERVGVQGLAERRKQEVRVLSRLGAGLCASPEACLILGLSRPTLHRFCVQGLLVGEKVRVWRGGRVRVVCVFRRAQVRALARRLAAERSEVCRRRRGRNGAGFARWRSGAGGSG